MNNANKKWKTKVRRCDKVNDKNEEREKKKAARYSTFYLYAHVPRALE